MLNFTQTYKLYESLRGVLHVPRSAVRRCSASEGNNHSSLSRLAPRCDEHVLNLVQLPNLG